MKRFSLYLTPTHSSITIQNGASRETSAPTIAEMLNHLTPSDETVVREFCTAVLAHLDRPQGAAILVNALVRE